MFGSLGNIAGMMKQAKEMQSRMKEMQEQLAGARFDGESGGGAVQATVTGKLELVALKIQREAVSAGDVEMLEDLVKAAVSAAQRRAVDGMKQEMQKLTGGLNIPGLDGLLGGG